MADRLTINRAPQRQVKKRTVRNCRRSGQFALPEDREAFRRIRGRVSPARKPFAIAQEFGDAKIQDPDHCEISGLAARSGEETSAGCGLAQSRASDGRFLRRVESLTHEDTFQVPSTRKRHIDLRHRVLDGPGRYACAPSRGRCSPALPGTAEATTHTITGAIVRLGLVSNPDRVRWGLASHVLRAWIFTIPISARPPSPTSSRAPWAPDESDSH
jgi:hypothetical protein